MNIAELIVAIERNAVPFVFVNVLLEQLGLPVPAVPTFLLAGSLAATPFALGKVLAAAVFASLVADVVWYVAGRWLGYRVLAGLCYLSINPASCATQTEARFVRWGLQSVRPLKGGYEAWSKENSAGRQREIDDARPTADSYLAHSRRRVPPTPGGH